MPVKFVTEVFDEGWKCLDFREALDIERGHRNPFRNSEALIILTDL